jgi:hypothetical protein
MAWPRDTRNISFGPKEQVPSALLNELQDQIISLNSERERIFRDFYSDDSGAGAINLARLAPATDGEFVQGVAGIVAFCECPCEVGDTITEVQLKAYDSVGGAIGLEVFYLDLEFDDPTVDPSSATSMGTDTATAGGGFKTLTVTPGSPLVVAVDTALWVKVTGVTQFNNLYGVKVKYLPVII